MATHGNMLENRLCKHRTDWINWMGTVNKVEHNYFYLSDCVKKTPQNIPDQTLYSALLMSFKTSSSE